MDTFNFSPQEIQPFDAPIQRYPVKIIFKGKTCGYYVFGKTNQFEIYFDLNFENQSGSRFMWLLDSFNHEDECRQWLCKSVEPLIQGQNLNYTDISVELVRNPNMSKEDPVPYVWPAE